MKISVDNRLIYAGLFSINLLTPVAFASPWLEPHDPFLRSSLVLLSDAGKINAPTNQYPARWSLYGDDLAEKSDTDSDMVSIAEQELRHNLTNAKLNRGNRLAKFVYGTEAPLASGYGQFSKDEWGALASYEHLDNSFAFRVSTGYSKRDGEKDVIWDDSYLSLNAGRWLFTVGQLDRWWGQGWQHNLLVNPYSASTPDLSVSYTDDNSVLGVWNVESFVAKPDDADYYSATRFVAKPFSLFEFGLTYQYWFDNDIYQSDIDKLAFDAKLTLPQVASIYHNIYTEITSTSDDSDQDAWLLGWSGSFPVAEHTARLVLETQQATSRDSSHQWSANEFSIDGVVSSEQIAQYSFLLDKSYSAALYLQLNNDHNFSVSYQQADMDNQQIKTTQTTYRLPAFAGMVHVGLGYSKTQGSSINESNTNIWTGYEFRF